MQDKMRARLGPPTGRGQKRAKDAIFGEDTNCKTNILAHLRETNGIIWPYTPDIVFGATAEYNNFHFTHSNYPYQNYVKSMPAEITIIGVFTAQTIAEARYLLAVQRFLRAMTMIEFGEKAAANGKAGTPPPVLRFNYMGDHQFNNVPVVVTGVSYQLERDVDYVAVPGAGYVPDSALGPTQDRNDVTYVPTSINITTMLAVQQNPSRVRKDFDLGEFKSGNLLSRGFL